MRRLITRAWVALGLAGTILGSPRTEISPYALGLLVEQRDLQGIAAGLEEVFLRRPMSGHVPSAAHEESYLHLEVKDLSYAFYLKGIQLQLQGDRVVVAGTLADLHARMDRIFFDRARSRHCSNTLVSSPSGRIPFRVEMTLGVRSGYGLDVVPVATDVKLTSENFRVHTPQSCEAVWGLNWAIRRLLPVVANVMRSHVAREVETQIAAYVQNLHQSTVGGLNLEITLPWMGVEPLPPFTMRIAMTPTEARVLASPTKKALAMTLGAVVDIERSVALTRAPVGEAHAPQAVAEKRSLGSFFGVAPDFFNAILREARLKGLLEVELNGDVAPSLQPFLTTDLLGLFLPDAEGRFANTTEPISVRFHRVGGLTFVARKDQDRLGFNLKVQDTKLVFRVGRMDYFSVTMNGEIPMDLALDPGTQRLTLKLATLDTMHVDGAFEPGVDGIVDPTFKAANFVELLRMVGAMASDEGRRPFVEAYLPDAILGSKRVRFTHVDWADPFVALGFEVLGE